MKCKNIFFSFLFSTLLAFTFPVLGEDDAGPSFNSIEEYQDAVEQLIEDLQALKPSTLKDLCNILTPEEDNYSQTVLYYHHKHQLLASGFHFITDNNSHFKELIETINNNAEKQLNNCFYTNNCSNKNNCLKTLYSGLVGSSRMINEILNGASLNKLFNQTKKMEKRLNKVKKRAKARRAKKEF